MSASHATGGAVEGGEEPFASRVDLVASVTRQEATDRRVVRFDEVAPTSITESNRLFGGADEIREKNRGEYPIELGLFITNRTDESSQPILEPSPNRP
jgi:hypothetical protein